MQNKENRLYKGLTLHSLFSVYLPVSVYQQNYVHYLEDIFIKFSIKVISLVNGIDKQIFCDIRKLLSCPIYMHCTNIK